MHDTDTSHEHTIVRAREGPVTRVEKNVSESAGTAMPQPSALVAVLGLVFVARRAFISVPGGTI